MIEYKQPTKSGINDVIQRDKEHRRVFQEIDSILTEYNDYLAELKQAVEALGQSVPDVPRR